jgi:CYTH domain-containing protein
VLTVKVGRGRSRTEVELALDPHDASQLWAHTDGRRIEKVRHRIDVGAATAELDVYGGSLAGLLVVEVEFDSEDAADAFVVPKWFGRELTGDPAWSNASLARHGRPAQG